MAAQAEKVHVAIGTDSQDGFATLEWALRKWSSHPISIVILYAGHKTYNPSKDYVHTPFGKLPVSYVSDEKVQVLRKTKDGENDKLLADYKAFCGKVKAEILKIEKNDEHLHKLLVEMISELRITKLVMGITFMKSSSWKSRTAISGSFYVHRHKPEFCDLFIICGGKLVFLRGENNEGFVEDDHGVMVAKFKEKGTFRGWLGKILPESATVSEKNLRSSPSPSSSTSSPDQWENYVQEIETYFQQLLSSNSEDEVSEAEDNTLWNGQAEAVGVENMNAADKVEMLKIKIRKAHDLIQLKRKEAKANVERHAKAEWAICLCTRQAEELEARIKEEVAARFDLKKDLDTAKEEACEIATEIEDKRSKLKSMLELQRELSNRLQLSSLAKSHGEAQLEKAVAERAEMVREIEEMRRQRDIVQRRIEFCREKDAIGMATTSLSDLGFEYKDFVSEDIRAATDDFSERLRLKSAGDWTNVYRGRINHTTVAIKVYNNFIDRLHQEAFQAKVKVLSQIRHPHLVAMVGSCSDPNCIVFEYMHNGCLRDALFSSKRGSLGLNWHTRIRIAAEVASGLGFLHSAQPRPIAHGNLNPSKILLDRNLVAKIHGFGPDWSHASFDVRSDMRAFGNLILQLLTGRNWAGLVEEAIMADQADFIRVLDDMAGKWPLDLALELAKIAIRCLSGNNGPDSELSMVMVIRDIEKVRKKAYERVKTGECEVAFGGGAVVEDFNDVPSVFLCPIFQEVMKNPHLAADGFSYEQEAIEEWLKTGHDTSPMTNLKLKHGKLTPNHTLRCLIQDWHNKKSIPLA